MKGNYNEILRNIIADINDGSHNDYMFVNQLEESTDEIEALLKEKCPIIYLSKFH